VGHFSELTITALPNPNMWVLAEDFYYRGVDHQGVPITVCVEAGTTTDLGSIPMGLRNLANRNGRSRKPAVIHDFLYSEKWRTRKDCDLMFYHLLLENGMGKFRAYWMFYMGVRAGGWTRGSW